MENELLDLIDTIVNHIIKLQKKGIDNIINEKTTSRTLKLSDSGKYIRCLSSENVTITIPSNTKFSKGTEITIKKFGQGKVSIVCSKGVSLYIQNNPLTSVGSSVTIKKIDHNIWESKN